MIKLTHAGLLKLLLKSSGLKRSSILNFSSLKQSGLLDDEDLDSLLGEDRPDSDKTPTAMPMPKSVVLDTENSNNLENLVRSELAEFKLSDKEFEQIIATIKLAIHFDSNVFEILNDIKEELSEPYLDIDLERIVKDLPEDEFGTKTLISNWPDQPSVNVFEDIPLSSRKAQLINTLAAINFGLRNPGLAVLAILNNKNELLLKKNSSSLSAIEVEIEFPFDNIATPDFKSKSLTRLINEAISILGIPRKDFAFETADPMVDDKTILHVIKVPDSFANSLSKPNFDWFKISPDQIMKSKKTTLSNPKILKHPFVSNIFEGKDIPLNLSQIPEYKVKNKIQEPDGSIKKLQEALSSANIPSRVQLSVPEMVKLYKHIVSSGRVMYKGDHSIGRSDEAGISNEFLATIIKNATPVSTRMENGSQVWIAVWESNLPNPPGVHSAKPTATYVVAFNIEGPEAINIRTVIPKSGTGLSTPQAAAEERKKWKDHHSNIQDIISKNLVSKENLPRGSIISKEEYQEKSRRHRERETRKLSAANDNYFKIIKALAQILRK